MSSSSILGALNRTELYQLCRGKGLNVHPGSSREELMAYLTGELEPVPLSEAEHPIDSWRLGIISFLSNYWTVVEPQLKCPARKLKHPTEPNPRPCFGCLDAQAIACVIQNPGRNEHLIRTHRPNKE